MSVFTRYLLRSHLGPFLFAFVALTGVILVHTIARQLAELAGKGLPLDVVFRFFLLSLPSNVALTLPMSVLVAVLYTFSRLTSENEITALRASGVDLRRVLAPLLLAAMALAGTMAWFNSVVLPESNHQWKQLMIDIGRKSPVLTFAPQALNEIQAEDGRYYLHAVRIDPGTNWMQEVTIYDRTRSETGRTIYADSGRMAFSGAQTDLVLTLHDGRVHEVRLDDPREFQRLDFGQQFLRIAGVGNQLELQTADGFRSDREMTVGMLRERVGELRSRLDHLEEETAEIALHDLASALGREAVDEAGEAAPLPDPPRVTARQLRSQAGQRASTERAAREYRVEIHKKFAIATAPIVFILIGAPLAIRFPGGVGGVIAASLAIFSLYYVGLHGGETLADEGYIPPAIAMWFMNGLLGVLGVWGFLRLGRETTNPRGGGIPASLGTLLRRLRR